MRVLVFGSWDSSFLECERRFIYFFWAVGDFSTSEHNEDHVNCDVERDRAGKKFKSRCSNRDFLHTFSYGLWWNSPAAHIDNKCLSENDVVALMNVVESKMNLHTTVNNEGGEFCEWRRQKKLLIHNCQKKKTDNENLLTPVMCRSRWDCYRFSPLSSRVFLPIYRIQR